MSKKAKIIIIIFIIVLLVFGIAIAIYNHYKTEPIDTNTTNEGILDDANMGLDNLINDMLNAENTENVENTENTENAENSDENDTNTTNTKSASTTQTQSSQPSNGYNGTTEEQATPGEQKAIELVKAEWKKEWGNLDDVSFNNEYIQGDGKYVVSVNDSATTGVIRRYVVDTTTGVVDEK